MTSKFGIKVMLSKDDWVWVTKQDLGTLAPIVYDTYQEAEQFAASWRLSGKEAFVKVVEYPDEIV